MNPIAIAMGLAQFAPSIIKWITGSDKAEAAAGAVVDIATKVTGAKSPEEALAAITGNLQMQMQFRQAVMANETDLDKAYLVDRQNARSRDVELAKAGFRNVRADLMVLGAVAGLVACLVALIGFRAGLPGEAVGIISTIAGIFGACLRDAFQFEFGSSRGSREKDELIRKLG